MDWEERFGQELVSRDGVVAIGPVADRRLAVLRRAGSVTAEHGRVAVCAGRGTAPLARGAALPLPVRQSVHVRLTYPVRGAAPARLVCLQDGSCAFGEVGAYADPLPGNRDYAVGLGDTAIHEDGIAAWEADRPLACGRPIEALGTCVGGGVVEPPRNRA